MTSRAWFIIINLLWCVGILGFCLIGSLSVEWASVKDLPTVISVGLGIASLILALIAIIQTIVSSGTLATSLSDIGRAANNVLSVTSDLKGATEKFSAQFDSLGRMPTTLDVMRERLDTLAEKAQSGPSESQAVTTVEKKEFDPELAYKRSSNGVFPALYALMKSYETKIPFEFTDIQPGPSGMYKDGVIQGLRTAGVAGVRVNKNRKFVVDDLGIFSREMIVAQMDKRREAKIKNNEEYIDENRQLIDRFFAKD